MNIFLFILVTAHTPKYIHIDIDIFNIVCSSDDKRYCKHIDIHAYMQQKRHPSLEARRVARIGTSLLAAAALWLYFVSFSSSFSVSCVPFSVRLFLCVFLVHSSTFF